MLLNNIYEIWNHNIVKQDFICIFIGKYIIWEESINCTAVISEKCRCRVIFLFVSHFFAMLLYCPFRQFQFVFLNDVTLRCNPYIMCITRSTGYFGIMHTFICVCPINKPFLFWCGIVHWFRTISPGMVRHPVVTHTVIILLNTRYTT